MASQEDDGEVGGEKPFLEEPSADERLPPENSDFPLTVSRELSLPPASSDPRLTFSSLKRSGETLESGCTKERKKEEGAVREGGPVAVPRDPVNQVNLADFGVPPVNEDELRLALVPEDIQNSIELPTAGWPTYQTLCGRNPPIPLIYEQSHIAGLE